VFLVVLLDVGIARRLREVFRVQDHVLHAAPLRLLELRLVLLQVLLDLLVGGRRRREQRLQLDERPHGADLLTLHYEACADPLQAIREVKRQGVRVGMAIRPKTGEVACYYQYTPNDVYDVDGVDEHVLADLQIDGRPRKVMIQANKNGFLYVVDRTNCKLIAANPYTKVNWATKIDLATGRPVLTDLYKRFLAGEEVEIYPQRGSNADARGCCADRSMGAGKSPGRTRALCALGDRAGAIASAGVAGVSVQHF